jgi:inosine/xanthosine triphosphate pyrophosphatase family protein
LRDKAAKLFAEKDPDEKTIQQKDFLSDFSEEKKNLTKHRIKILKKIKECLSE